jgi:hypothetical protein
MPFIRLGSRLIVALLVSSAIGSAQEPPPAGATPENAATFLGDWTLEANGQYGPATFALALKAAEGKVVGEISSAATPKQSISDVTKAGASLVLRYVLDYQGMPVNVIIRLTPAEGKVAAEFDFADGAAQMVGTATKKAS